ncbi:hypothetical protein K4K48_008162 [Colletotrichum sp. SAR 10_66]|nr:hypothetical protein K4K52_000071 [Colletotrichum sp. SAR 10_76]KAJ5008037.1 hypothetical protein K4K48_008162 [Colletotrichum sp. SAR 10_66]
MIPKEPIAEFSQKLVVQFRIAQNKGLISPNVCLGDSGLVWEGMQEEIKCARGLHSDISIDQMVAADAAVQANLLTENDQSLLHRLLADLEGDSGVPRCLRPFKNAIDPFEEAPTKTSIAALIQEMGQSAETAMNRITEFGNGDQQGEPAFVKHIMKPCCMLLDIDYPGTPVEGHRAIVQSDLDVGMAVSAIMYLRMLPDTGDLRDAVQKLKCSSRFKPTWRFLLFKDKLSGIGFDEERKHLWQKAFGEPFERV